jgi:tRNA-dihydrouridine synthase 2
LRFLTDVSTGPETVDRSLIGTTRRINPHTSTIDFTRYSSNGQKLHQASDPNAAPQKESLIFRIDPTIEKSKLIFQIGTSSPELAVAGAKIIAADVAGIDVNAGCPKPFSTTGGMGAALLREPDLLCSILEALVKEVGAEHEIGISVKIRVLETAEETEALVRRLVATGITGLTVHCRTRDMRPRQRAIRQQLPMIAEICREAGVAILMNGDVYSRPHAVELAKEFKVDGGMIATAAESNPSVFRSPEQGGVLPWLEVSEELVKISLNTENRLGNTKFLLSNIIPGKSPLHRSAVQAKSYIELCKILGMEDCLTQAADVDDHLELSPAHIEAKKQEADEMKKAKTAAKAQRRAMGGPVANAAGGVMRTKDESRSNLSERGVGQTPTPMAASM